MADIKPFRGYHYNQEKVENLKSVLSPPYDVISEEDREILHGMSPYNIVRLIGGKSMPDDDDQDNKYTRASNSFETWKKEEVLIRRRGGDVFSVALKTAPESPFDVQMLRYNAAHRGAENEIHQRVLECLANVSA